MSENAPRDTRCKYSETLVEGFLIALSEGMPIRQAVKHMGVDRGTVYNWRRSRKDFRDRWEQALDAGATALEEEAMRRAYEGIDEPVFYQGKVVGHVRKYSDRLMEKLLEARSPEKFGRKQRHEHTGQGGNPILTAAIDTEGMTLEQLRAIASVPIKDSGRAGGEE